ncbi:MAG: transposase [Actinobacteria bacterium]|nr:transposase [Actinomycetota bacterium]
MAYNYKVPLRDQLFLLPPSIADWLPEEHLVWFVLDVVAVVDLSAFHARHPNDGAGRAAYDPEMMLALLVYGYCRGLRSSRRIEAACRADLAFRAICADVVPDHIAVARFRADHTEAIRAVFIDVLALCAKAGLASLGTIAIDGTKIAADAALGANRSEGSIAAEVDAILAQAGRADEAEALQPSLLLGKAEEVLTAATKAAAEAPDPPAAQANTTDPESRIMKTASGWVQGFNAQAAVNAKQIVVACALTQDRNDVGQLVPMMAAVTANAAAAGIDGDIGTVLGDAGYWSEANATAPGPDRLIATSKDWKQRRAARAMGTTTGPAPEGASALEAMEHRLRTEEGAAAYGQRSCTVEPIFGQVKENRGIRRFMRRGIAAAESEWALVCATGNILKLHGHAQGRSLGATISPAT